MNEIETLNTQRILEKKAYNYKELLVSLGQERKEKIEAEQIRRIKESKKKKGKPKKWNFESMMRNHGTGNNETPLYQDEQNSRNQEEWEFNFFGNTGKNTGLDQ